MLHYTGVAGEMGVTDREIGEVMANVMFINGNSVRVRFRKNLIEAKKAARERDRKKQQ